MKYQSSLSLGTLAFLYVTLSVAQETQPKAGLSVGMKTKATGSDSSLETKADASADAEAPAKNSQKAEGETAPPAADIAPPMAQSGVAEPKAAREGAAEPQTDAQDTTAAPLATSDDAELPYMKRYIPEANMWELGLFGGIMFPSGKHELYEPGNSELQQGFKAAGDIGARVAYFPLNFVGVELEGAVMPSKVKDGTAGGLWALRGHLVAQWPGNSVIPFALIGGGALGADSDAMGSDADPALHFGLGVKAALDEHITARFDFRDTMSQKFDAGSGSQTHHPELLFGLTFVPRRTLPDRDGDGFADHADLCPNESGKFRGCQAPDSDRDGVSDDLDECPEVASSHPSGCPDSDGDGTADPKDFCPDVAGTGPAGCPEKVCAPVTASDADGDGIPDERDQCPTQAAKTENGCPLLDKDGDGISDAEDKCIDKPETANGFQDADGCPDELPAEVKKFSGVMKGIQFQFASAKIEASSNDALNKAAKVMKTYPSLKIEISGHSDATGDREKNITLSQARANSVRTYLVAQGVEENRIQTKGYGPDQPIGSNETPEGRQKNRRIEFRLLTK